MARRYWYVILTYILMQFSVYIGAPLLLTTTSMGPVDANIYWSIFSFIAGLFIVLWFLRQDMDMTQYKRTLPLGQLILWAIVGFFMAYGVNVLAGMIEQSLLGINPSSENTQQIMEFTRSAPLFIVITTLIAPILEEIVFRKIIFGTFYKRMNFFLAALLSALIFGFIHGEPQHILVYASMGFVFAFLYVKTKRIIIPIIAHMSMNSLAVVFQLLLDPEQIEQMLKKLEQMQTILLGG